MSATSPPPPPTAISPNVSLVAVRKKSGIGDVVADAPPPQMAASGPPQPLSSPTSAPSSPPVHTESSPPSMTSSSSKKPHLKEKITQMYECLLRGDDTDAQPQFWAEFFLLRPKIGALETEIAGAKSDAARRNLNRLFAECVSNLSSDHAIRVVYALQTLCGTVRAVTNLVAGRSASKGGKSSSSSSSSAASGMGGSGELIGWLVGLDKAEQTLLELITHLNE